MTSAPDAREGVRPDVNRLMQVDREPGRLFHHVPEFPRIVRKYGDRPPDVVHVLLPGSLDAVHQHRGMHEAGNGFPSSVVARGEIGRVHLKDLAVAHVPTHLPLSGWLRRYEPACSSKWFRMQLSRRPRIAEGPGRRSGRRNPGGGLHRPVRPHHTNTAGDGRYAERLSALSLSVVRLRRRRRS
jgi:hypothetical protein